MARFGFSNSFARVNKAQFEFLIRAAILPLLLLGASEATAVTQERDGTVSPEHRSALKDYANRLRNQGAGVLLTPAEGSARAGESREILQTVLERLAEGMLDLAKIHVRVNLYSALHANAFATKPKIPENSPGLIHRFLGMAEDGLPLYEIGINQGILPLFKSEDELAFILGHELGHIALRHTETVETNSEKAEKWFSSQANEVDADHFALDAMKGKYELHAGYDVMERLLKDSGNPKLFNIFLSSHHHPSVRLAALLAKTELLRKTESAAAPRSFTPLDPKTRLVHRAGRNNRISTDFEAYRDEYFRWFDQFLGPRSEPLVVHPQMWSKESFPILRDKKLFSDATSALFQESLKRILAFPNLSAAEKLERVFELLTVYSDALSTSTGDTSSIRTVAILDKKDLSALMSTLKQVGFSKTSDWDPASLVESFGRRMSPTDRSYSVKKMLRDLVQRPTLQPIFERLAQASTRWAEFNRELFSIKPGLSSSEFFSLVKNALEQPWPEDRRKELLGKMAGYSLTPLYGEQNGINHAGMIYSMVAEEMADRQKDPVVHRAMLELLKRNRPEYVARLKRRLEQILTMNPAKMNQPELSAALHDITSILHRRMDAGLTAAEVGPAIRRCWEWLESARNRYKSNDFSMAFDLALDDAAKCVGQGLAKGYWSPAEAREIFLKLAPRLRDDEMPMLRRMDTADLKLMLLRKTEDAIQDRRLVGEVSNLLQIPTDEIRRVGLNRELLDRFRHGRSKEELEEALEQLPEYSESFRKRKIRMADASVRTDASILSDETIARRLLPSLSTEQFAGYIQNMKRQTDQNRTIEMLVYSHLLLEGSTSPYLATGAAENTTRELLHELARRQSHGLDFQRWARLYEDIMKSGILTPITIPLENRVALAGFLDESLGRLPILELGHWLKKSEFLNLLTPDRAGHYLAKSFLAETAQISNLEQRAEKFQSFQAELELKELPQANHILEQEVAQSLRLQPGQMALFFPPAARLEVTQFGGHIRGLSGITAKIQTLPVAEQLEFIEYIMGRQSVIPAAVMKLNKEVQDQMGKQINLGEIVIAMRGQLANESSLVRALAITPLFTGPSSISGHPDGVDRVLDQLLKSISPANRDLARELAQGILKGEGRSAPLALSFVLAQHSSGAGLSEGEILRSLFNAYGVPGVKFGQYLAFTSEMGAVREVLSALQDQAMPISYLEAVSLLESRFPAGMPDGIQILGIKGSGSVNIGIEYFNPKSGHNEILTVTRAEIETATAHDFRRLRSVLDRLTATPEGTRKFGFMRGLDDVIHESVLLEFDRKQVFENHLELSQILNRKVDGWQVRMVKPLSLENGVIRMEMAQGIPATRFETQDPRAYRSAMRAASKVMTDHLLQEDGSAEKGLHYYADSDFHNGQAFMDPKTKTVWLIDPGQSIQIGEKDHQTALEVLRILSRTTDLNNSVTYLNASALNPRPGTALFTRAEVELLQKNRDTADAFIKLIGMVKSKGGSVPLPVVQWILGMNRQLALSRKLGTGLEKRLFAKFAKQSFRGLAAGRAACGKDVLAMFRRIGH